MVRGKPIIRTIFFSLLQLTVTLLSLEWISQVGLHLISHRAGLSTHNYIEQDLKTIAFVRSLGRWNSHPYFGFSEEGYFNGVEDALLKSKAADEFVVGIAGANTAVRLYQELENSPSIKEKFAQALQLKPRLKLKFLCLAHNGYKQPQTFLTLLRYYELLDYLILVDGKNDFEGLHLFPALPFIFPGFLFHPYLHNTSDNPWSYYLAHALRELGKNAIDLLPRSDPISHLAITQIFRAGFVHLFLPFYAHMQKQTLKAFWEKYPQNEDQILRAKSHIFQTFTRKSHEWLDAKKIKFIHFLEPTDSLQDPLQWNSIFMNLHQQRHHLWQFSEFSQEDLKSFRNEYFKPFHFTLAQKLWINIIDEITHQNSSDFNEKKYL